MKYSLITGASAGIGRAMAYRFASAGHHLILVARRDELLAEIKHDISKQFAVQVVTIKTDLSDKQQVLDLYQAVQAYDIALLINNAGFGDYNKAWSAHIEKMSSMIEVNIHALMILSLLYIRDYKDKPVQLINVSSRFGYYIFEDSVTYAATKFFVSSFTEGIAQNLRNSNCRMRVKLLAPGAVDSEFVANSLRRSKHPGIRRSKPHTCEQMAEFAYQLYESDRPLGIVDENRNFILREPIYPYGKLPPQN